MQNSEAIQILMKIGLKRDPSAQCARNGTLRFYDPETDCRYTLNARTGYYRREYKTFAHVWVYGKKWDPAYLNATECTMKKKFPSGFVHRQRIPILVYDLEKQVYHVRKLVKHYRQHKAKQND